MRSGCKNLLRGIYTETDLQHPVCVTYNANFPHRTYLTAT